MHVLCVCTGNTCRSPMLACLLRDAAARAGQELSVSSAGMAADSGMPASEQSVSCMRECGLDLSEHRSRPVDLLEAQHADLVLCLGPQHAEALRRAGVPAERIRVINAEQGGVSDPFGGNLADYRACAQILAQAVEQLIRELQS